VAPNSPFRTRVTRAGDPEWDALESQILRARLPFPLPARAAWGRLHGTDARLVTAHESDGSVQGAVAVEVALTRALPAHRMLRALHSGSALVGLAGEALVIGLRTLADSEPRILQLNVELVLRTPEEHARAGELLRAAGFSRLEKIRHYPDTVVVDLAGSESEILASFSQTTRRVLRGWLNLPLELRPILDTRYVSRLNDLGRDTFARTGGDYHPRPWVARMALCATEPSASRLVGIFRTGRDDPESLLAFAWACSHGDHAHFDDAGSTRVSDFKVQLMTPLMWNLICWAKGHGCGWFDLGGTTDPNDRSDPLTSISDFKRRFSKVVVSVGAEWVYEPHPARSTLVRLARTAVTRLSG